MNHKLRLLRAIVIAALFLAALSSAPISFSVQIAPFGLDYD